MKKENTKEKILKYNELLLELKKSDVESILINFDINYKKNTSKENLIETVVNNVESIVDSTLDIFQEDELANIKLIIKKKGNIHVTVNHYFKKFLNNFERLHLLKKINQNDFLMPKELLNIYTKKIKNKSVINKIKRNTEEYALIMGFIETYGFRTIKDLYEIYKNKYEINYNDFQKRIIYIGKFYNEYKTYSEKNDYYISSLNINGIAKGKKYLNKKNKYKEYTCEDLININNFSKFSKVKSYKKLSKYILRNYYVEKGNFKIINRFILCPYFIEKQVDKNKSQKLLEELIGKYFEIKDEKNKKKFIELIDDFFLDYPSWSLHGFSERD